MFKLRFHAKQKVQIGNRRSVTAACKKNVQLHTNKRAAAQLQKNLINKNKAKYKHSKSILLTTKTLKIRI